MAAIAPVSWRRSPHESDSLAGLSPGVAAVPSFVPNTAIKLPSSAPDSERGGQAMTVSRALLFATFMVAAPFAAYAQFGGMPGMPSGVPGGGSFGGPPAEPPPACRELMSMRDEVQKHGTAIQKAN